MLDSSGSYRAREQGKTVGDTPAAGWPGFWLIPHCSWTEQIYLLCHCDCSLAEQHVRRSSDQRLPTRVFCRLVSAGRTGSACAHCVYSTCVSPWQAGRAWPHNIISRGLSFSFFFFPQRLGWVCFLTLREPLVWDISSGYSTPGFMSSTVLALSPSSIILPPFWQNLR